MLHRQMMHSLKLMVTMKRLYSTNETTFLTYLKQRMMASGPLTVASYMKEALTNPVWGYYMKKDVFGSKGDFITSPEISQIFGELVGIWYLNEWMQAGKPQKINLVELGPGRGTLISDILRVFGQFKGILETTSVHLVEVSPELKNIQMKNLIGIKDEISKHTSKTPQGVPVTWHQNLQDVPKGFTFYLAHEFFDALPVHLFQKKEEGWREVLIDIDNDALCFVMAPGPSLFAEKFIPKTSTADQWEACPDAAVIIDYMSRNLEEYGGSAFIVDYGEDGCNRHSLRAFRNHQLQDDVLKDPGCCDITCNVNFSFLKNACCGRVQTFGPVTQRNFLNNMGINTRYQVLLKNATAEQAENLRSAYHYLCDPEKMGNKFKMLALINKGRAKPAAF